VLKANHGHAFEAVREHFERTCLGLGSGGRPVFDAFEEGHGRLVRRRVFMDPAAKDPKPLSGWPECCWAGAAVARNARQVAGKRAVTRIGFSWLCRPRSSGAGSRLNRDHPVGVLARQPRPGHAREPGLPRQRHVGRCG
jgi:hypothetical protein